MLCGPDLYKSAYLPGPSEGKKNRDRELSDTRLLKVKFVLNMFLSKSMGGSCPPPLSDSTGPAYIPM